MSVRTYWIIMVVTAVILGFCFAVLASSLAGAQTSAAGATRVYQYPANELAPARACYTEQREALGIPADLDAYVEWWGEHEGTAVRAAWSAAFEQCQDAYLVTPRFAWGRLVLVGTR